VRLLQGSSDPPRRSISCCQGGLQNVDEHASRFHLPISKSTTSTLAQAPPRPHIAYGFVRPFPETEIIPARPLSALRYSTRCTGPAVGGAVLLREDATMSTAEMVVETVADAVVARAGQVSAPMRVAVDGRDGAGKTIFADRLGTKLMARGKTVYRASIDDWQMSRDLRYRRGPESAEGYYLDGFNHEGFRSELLEPFATGREARLADYDIAREVPIEGPRLVPAARGVLVVDRVFLLRQELRDCWEFTIYLDVDPAVAMERGIARDIAISGDAEEERRHLYLVRYRPGQDLYHAAAEPTMRADIVINNSDFDMPVIT
jgi:uridine kinase